MSFKAIFKIRVVFPIPVFPMIYLWSLRSSFLNPKTFPFPLKSVLAKKLIRGIEKYKYRRGVLVLKHDSIRILGFNRGIIGIVLGFMSNLLRDWIQEKKTKRIYLEDLLADLEYNKKLAEKDRGWGYHTMGYTDAKGAKYL